MASNRTSNGPIPPTSSIRLWSVVAIASSDRRLAVDVPPDLPLIHVDPVLVQQALIQIFDNAVKYSVANSQIAVAAHTHDGQLISASPIRAPV